MGVVTGDADEAGDGSSLEVFGSGREHVITWSVTERDASHHGWRVRLCADGERLMGG